MVWKTRALFLETESISEGPGGRGPPHTAPLSPLSHVGQLTAGPRVAVAARFAAGVRGAAQLAVPLRGVLGAVPAVCLLPAAPSQSRLVAHCKDSSSEVLTPKTALVPHGDPHQEPQQLLAVPAQQWGDLPRVLCAAVAAGGFTAPARLLAGEGALTGW